MWMRTSTFKVGENVHKITRLTIFIKQGLKVSQAWLVMKRLRFMVKETIRKAREWQPMEMNLELSLD